MKLKVRDMLEIAKICKSKEFAESHKKSFEWACPQSLDSKVNRHGEIVDSEFQYKTILVQYDYTHGWVMEFSNQEMSS
jgi:hypothetical protein